MTTTKQTTTTLMFVFLMRIYLVHIWSVNNSANNYYTIETAVLRIFVVVDGAGQTVLGREGNNNTDNDDYPLMLYNR
jgi:hypothetical protein